MRSAAVVAVIHHGVVRLVEIAPSVFIVATLTPTDIEPARLSSWLL
jgi:hypothetical protein